jgi:predicted ATPase/DNA-binding XRE family transcriptional regulator
MVDTGTDVALGVVLRRLRAEVGMTQEELADRAGISARTVSDVERGLRVGVRPDTARRLASALGLGNAERARFGAVARGLSTAARPPARAGAVPVPPTRLLGRFRELADISTHLQDPDVRLLTLTGPGGIGKTRLALEAAVRGRFDGGTFFVPLGELTDASLVASELAKATGVVETGPDLVALVTQRLTGSRALVVLDTFEHLINAAPLVYSLMLNCPETTFLVTSRSALRLRGEHEFLVPPLEVPDATRAAQPDDVHTWPATALFWERARAVQPDLALTPENAELITDICRTLDGLPLAIELAAARVKHLPLAAIRAQFGHRLALLVGGPLDLPLRQRAIRDTVRWSHDLLAPQEQALFRRLSVFAGGWSLEDVQDVAGDQADVGDSLEGISALVDHSLVALERNRADPRYDMLDVVREYAAACLAEAGESEDVERRHALHYLALAEAAEPHLVRTGHQAWFRRLDADRGNLRRGLAWTLDHGETVLGLRYTVALWRYWRHLGEFAEGRRWSNAALAARGEVPPSLRAKALCAAAALAFPQADSARMAELAGEAILLAQQSDDPMDLRNALTIQGFVAMSRGRYAGALEPYTECVAICRPLGPSWQLATSHLNLGAALLHCGRTLDAVAALEEALRLYRSLGDEVFAARALNHLAHAALARNDVARADRLARQALASVAEQGERQGIAEGLDTVAAVAAASSAVDRAAILSGAAAAVREAIAFSPAPFDVAITGHHLNATRATVSEERWQHGWDRGRALDPAEAVAVALENDSAPGLGPPGPRAPMP